MGTVDAISRATRVRAGAALSAGALACGASAAAVVAWSAPWGLTVLRHPGGATLSDVLALVAAATVVVVLGWAVGAVAVSALGALARRLRPGRLVPRRLDALERTLVPAAVRRLAALALGAGVIGSVGAPAFALTPASSTATVSVVPGWPGEGAVWDLGAVAARPGHAATAPAPAPPVLARGSAAAPAPAPGSTASPALTAARGPSAIADVVVVRGDSLWAIAERHLPAGAPASAVAAEWPRWWALNHAVVGDDPDVLLPGQVLRAPAPTAPTAPGTTR